MHYVQYIRDIVRIENINCLLNLCLNPNYFPNISRNHNAIGQVEQDPGIWPELAEVSRFVLNLRYQYLPYLYTLFHDVSKT